MKKSLLITAIVVLILGALVYFNLPKLEIISGYAAKNMASTLELTERSAESVAEHDNDVSMIRWANTEIGKQHSVEADVLGLAERKAVCRGILGCVVVPPGAGDMPPALPEPRISIPADPRPYPYGHGEPVDTVLQDIDYEQVRSAIDLAFSNPETQRTRTVLILYRGQLLGERYSEGFGPETPVLGWSMTKSILATLYGILQHQGKMKVTDKVPIEAWQNDERSEITYEHLLRMNSSLAWEEDYSGISDVTRMLFQARDMSIAQADNDLVGEPGSVWNYSSGSSNVLAGALYKFLPDTLAYLEFPYKELASPLGMQSFRMETDWVGNFVGSSYGWASTRDWGRFGQLYLDEGQWNGKTLFDREWVDFITTPTEGSDGEYGAHFWLNKGGTYPGVPADLFSANGYQGQHVFIIPSKDLVIVRTGLAESPDFRVNDFLEAVIEAVP